MVNVRVFGTEREIYSDEHFQFAAVVGDFLEKKVVPFQDNWADAGVVSREAYRAAGAMGVVGLAIPEEFGGSGAPFSFNCIFTEQVAYSLSSFGALRVHMDVVVPYLTTFGTDEQKQRWLPGMADATIMTSIAMTEPAAGSDIAGIRTTLRRDGDDWILNGSKTFITGGTQSDLTLVVARSSEEEDRRKGLTLAVVEEGMSGFERGPIQRKIGLHAQDTCDLFFNDVRIPADNIIGEPGGAFTYLARNLAQERLSIAVNSQAQALAALEITIRQVKERSIFGRSLSSFQNTKFTLADIATRVDAGQAIIDRAISRHDEERLSPEEAARVKLFASELHGEVVDTCLQLFGGQGYMYDLPIAKLYTDARVARIYGGTSEVMKMIIAKGLQL